MSPSATVVGPRRIMVIRHAEKPDPRGGAGILPDGAGNSHALTVRGWQRAGALAVLFGGDLPRATALSRPTRLLAPDYGADGALHRTVQTLQPLAERWELGVETPCPRGRAAELVLRHVLGRDDDAVLICWDHENIAVLVEALATAVSVSPEPVLPLEGWPDDRFDVVLVFTRTDAPDGRYTFAEVPQLLLAGDAAVGLGGQK